MIAQVNREKVTPETYLELEGDTVDRVAANIEQFTDDILSMTF